MTLDLAGHQRAMLALVLGDESAAAPTLAAGDAYVASVAGSMQLDVVRDIGDAWRRFSLQRMCPLTWRLLEQTGRLDLYCERMGRRRALSPFLQILARQFLDELVAGGDPIETAVARFERALIDSPGAAPDECELVIDWPCDPEVVLSLLLADHRVGSPPPDPHRTWAPAADPAAFRVCRLDDGRRDPSGAGAVR